MSLILVGQQQDGNAWHAVFCSADVRPCLQQSTLLGSFAKVAKPATPSASAADSNSVTEGSAVRTHAEASGPGHSRGDQESRGQGQGAGGQCAMQKSPKRQKTAENSAGRSHLQPLDNRASVCHL